MPIQRRQLGNAGVKRNSWIRGNGPCSFRGELKRSIAMNKKYLNRKVRHEGRTAMRHSDYKRVVPTLRMVDFT